MRHMQVALPDQLIAEIDALVQDGWFNSQDALVRLALLEFIRRQGGPGRRRVSTRRYRLGVAARRS
jgi:Arc/MetJ-type ribon-helix-helix transcriptional regulator